MSALDGVATLGRYRDRCSQEVADGIAEAVDSVVAVLTVIQTRIDKATNDDAAPERWPQPKETQ